MQPLPNDSNYIHAPTPWVFVKSQGWGWAGEIVYKYNSKHQNPNGYYNLGDMAWILQGGTVGFTKKTQESLGIKIALIHTTRATPISASYLNIPHLRQIEYKQFLRLCEAKRT